MAKRTPFPCSHFSDPAFFQENRLPPHADFTVYKNMGELSRGRSSFYRSLAGNWFCYYAHKPDDVPEDFYAMDYDAKAWDTVFLPSTVETSHIDQGYPWEGQESIVPGLVPSRHNPTFCYVSYFMPPESFENLFVSFQGASSAIVVYFNGHYIGYSEDSATPADFDLTPYVIKSGENKLAVLCVAYSSGSWLENIELTRNTGLFRSVILYTKPQHHIEDISVTARPISDYQSGDLSVHLCLSGKGKKRIDLALFDETGKLCLETSQETEDSTLTIGGTVDAVSLWSAEVPTLYAALLSLYDEKGRLLELTRLRVGFREIEKRGKDFFLNGRPLALHGVNRHEFSHSKSIRYDENLIEYDIIAMKHANINAVRTSHAPSSSRLYELADLYGLYIIDEMNLDTTRSWINKGSALPNHPSPLGDDAVWLAPMLKRAEAMVERDKNHPSVLIWSYGNLPAEGKNYDELKNYYQEKDTSRPALYHPFSLDFDREFEGHALFHTSSLDPLVKRYPMTPRLQELKAKYQPFLLTPSEHGIHIHNRTLATDAIDYELRLHLLVEGQILWETTLPPISVPAGKKHLEKVAIPSFGKGEHILQATLHLRRATRWAPAGFEIAFGETVLVARQTTDLSMDRLLQDNHHTPKKIERISALRITVSDFHLGVAGTGFSLLFSSSKGTLISYRYAGHELFDAPPEAYLNTEHAATCKSIEWRVGTEASYHLVEDFFGKGETLETTAEHVTVRFTYELLSDPSSLITLTYTVYSSGKVDVEQKLLADDALSRREDFFTLFTLPSRYHFITFYGKGPQACYAGHDTGARLGIYDTTAMKAWQADVFPEGYGNHTCVRWIKIKDDTGHGLSVIAEETIDACALPHRKHLDGRVEESHAIPRHTYLYASSGVLKEEAQSRTLRFSFMGF